ncbi:MAG TPA: hypothetical protein VEG28_01835 [Dehalococcoidia bacterium]|nr:hypothetical protein [Dehalococcoidia bacterium]
MKHCEVNGSLYGELEETVLHKIIKHSLYSGGLPQTPEDQVGTNLPRSSLLQIAGLHQVNGLSKTRQRTQKSVSGTIRGQLV